MPRQPARSPGIGGGSALAATLGRVPVRGVAFVRGVVLAVAAALVLGVAVAGCGGGSAGRPAVATGADRSSPAGPDADPCVPAGPTPSVDAAPLAGVTLPCLPSGGSVRLSRLGRPAVINLWASWCEPCRTELPAVAAFARRAGGAVLVVGVATATPRAAAGDIMADLRLTFPNLYDGDRALLLAIGRTALPVTLFVTADGRVAHLYNGKALDTDAVARLAQQYLNVTV